MIQLERDGAVRIAGALTAGDLRVLSSAMVNIRVGRAGVRLAPAIYHTGRQAASEVPRKAQAGPLRCIE